MSAIVKLKSKSNNDSRYAIYPKLFVSGHKLAGSAILLDRTLSSKGHPELKSFRALHRVMTGGVQ